MLRSFLVCLFLYSAVSGDSGYPRRATAIAFKSGPVGGICTSIGTVTFTQLSGGANVTVSGFLNQVPSGPHGFHIHQVGSIEPNCTAAGPHFNPTNMTHGGPYDSTRHIGDLGNIVAGGNYQATVDISMALDSLPLSGPNSIIGRAVVVHERADDGGHTGQPGSDTTGNAGGRLACGVIGLATDFTIAEVPVVSVSPTQEPKITSRSHPYSRGFVKKNKRDRSDAQVVNIPLGHKVRPGGKIRAIPGKKQIRHDCNSNLLKVV